MDIFLPILFYCIGSKMTLGCQLPNSFKMFRVLNK